MGWWNSGFLVFRRLCDGVTQTKRDRLGLLRSSTPSPGSCGVLTVFRRKPAKPPAFERRHLGCRAGPGWRAERELRVLVATARPVVALGPRRGSSLLRGPGMWVFPAEGMEPWLWYSQGKRGCSS